MKGALPKLILVTIVCGIGLWLGVKWFVGGTDELASTINVRSLSHLREGYSGSSSNSSPAVQQGISVSTPTEPVQSISFTNTERATSPSQSPAQKDQKERERQRRETDAAEKDDTAEPEQDDAPEEVEVEPVIEEIIEVDGPLEDPDDEYVDLSPSERLEQEEIKDSSSLRKEEIKAREEARRKRLADLGLLPKKSPKPTIAVDVSLEMPDQCAGANVAKVPVGLKFRFESSLIKGESLNALESLVALYRECEQGLFTLAQNPLGKADATDSLTQMRFDEIKYFFIQHSVPIEAVQFSEE